MKTDTQISRHATNIHIYIYIYIYIYKYIKIHIYVLHVLVKYISRSHGHRINHIYNQQTHRELT